MNKWVFFGFLQIFMLFGCKEEEKQVDTFANLEPKEILVAMNGDIPVYDFEHIEPLFHSQNDKIHVINFWATWCVPCIKELPYFERINEEEKNNDVEVILVSMDMPSIWESRLIPYVEENNIMSKVVVLDDPKQNKWIPLVDENWSGAIPATVIYNKSKSVFYEQSFTYDELKVEINKFKK